jgi:hypothetical protein
MGLEFEWSPAGAGSPAEAVLPSREGLSWVQVYGSRWNRGVWIWIGGLLLVAACVAVTEGFSGIARFTVAAALIAVSTTGFVLNRRFTPIAWAVDAQQTLTIRMANGKELRVGRIVESGALSESDVGRFTRRSIVSLRFFQERFHAGTDIYEVVGLLRNVRTIGLFRFECPWLLGHSTVTWGSYSLGTSLGDLGIVKLDNWRRFILTAWTREALRAGLGAAPVEPPASGNGRGI